MSNAINTLSCQHCGNNNPNFMSFGSIDFVKSEYENNYMFINIYEVTPKLAVGFYFSCGKCGKDTVIIPTSFGQRKYSSAIPQQIIYTSAFNKVVFAIYNSGLNTRKLDQLILDSQGIYISSLTGQKVVSDGSWRDLDSQMKETERLTRVLMDNFKDSKMLLEYAKEAKNKDHKEMAKYYIETAEARCGMIKKDYKQLMELFRYEESKTGTKLPEGKWDCLHQHYLDEIEELEEEISKFRV